MTAFTTILAVIALAVILAIGPFWLAGFVFIGIFALGKWLTLPSRCPECNQRMLANWQLHQDECRGCGLGKYWK